MKMVDSNPRWRSEDIVDLDLVIPVRKSPAAKDDPNTVDAIGAILAMSMDDEIEQLPLNEIRKNRQKKYLKAAANTRVGARNIKPPIAPLDSALKMFCLKKFR